MSLERKLRRNKANKEKKSAEKEMATKVALFGKLPDKCLTCEEPFDKMNKEQVKTWNVVVRQDNDTVRLYCPQCWEKAVNIIQDFKKHLEEKNKK
ncbi:hypothetical protein CMI37_11765 [Candidatus Pacearchaeota archaeon]|nr:hypothetical protein [Candidatus Pacearchaeota archaeon]